MVVSTIDNGNRGTFSGLRESIYINLLYFNIKIRWPMCDVMG